MNYRVLALCVGSAAFGLAAFGTACSSSSSGGSDAGTDGGPPPPVDSGNGGDTGSRDSGAADTQTGDTGTRDSQAGDTGTPGDTGTRDSQVADVQPDAPMGCMPPAPPDGGGAPANDTGQFVDLVSMAGVTGVTVSALGQSVAADGTGNFTLPVATGVPFTLSATAPNYWKFNQQEMNLSGDFPNGPVPIVSSAIANV